MYDVNETWPAIAKAAAELSSFETPMPYHRDRLAVWLPDRVSGPRDVPNWCGCTARIDEHNWTRISCGTVAVCQCGLITHCSTGTNPEVVGLVLPQVLRREIDWPQATVDEARWTEIPMAEHLDDDTASVVVPHTDLSYRSSADDLVTVAGDQRAPGQVIAWLNRELVDPFVALRWLTSGPDCDDEGIAVDYGVLDTLLTQHGWVGGEVIREEFSRPLPLRTSLVRRYSLNDAQLELEIPCYGLDPAPGVSKASILSERLSILDLDPEELASVITDA